ncbi:MAG: molecular chaperone TorD family protein [Chloroflexi bacterium]|nr:molecular chaperone TorD family protein [Chloroflexota bacterium]
MQQESESGLAMFCERRMYAASRATFYSFLSGAFGDRPSSRLVRLIRDGTMVSFAEAYPCSRKYAKHLRRIANCIDAHVLQEPLAIEHTRLFVGPGEGYLPPYESVQARTRVPFPGAGYETVGADVSVSPGWGAGNWPSRTYPEPAGYATYAQTAPSLWGDAALDAQRCYAEAGFETSAAVEALPDHISTELDFMRLLCLAEAQAWQDATSSAASHALHRQRTFLNHHLLAWVPGYCCLVEGQARHPFFAALAALTSGFLYEEADLLNQLHGESLATTGGNA